MAASRLNRICNEILALSAENCMVWARYVTPSMESILDALIRGAKGYSFDRTYTNSKGVEKTMTVIVPPNVRAAELIFKIGLGEADRAADMMVSLRRADTLLEQTKVFPEQRKKLIAETRFTERTTLAFDRELVDNEDVVNAFFRWQGAAIGWLQAQDVALFPTDEASKERFIARAADAFEQARFDAMSEFSGQRGFLTPIGESEE